MATASRRTGNKTQATALSVVDYIAAITPDQRRKDCEALDAMMRKLSGETPKMWGTAIVGYGDYHYEYDSGREGDFFRTGFSSRKAALSIYIMGGFERHAPLMAKLGKHKIGKSCLYVKQLDDLDNAVLKQVIKDSLAYMKAQYP